jgi:hypothetical protein
MAAALDDDNKAAGRCRCNNQIAVMAVAVAGGDIGRLHNSGIGQWRLTLSAMEDDKTMGNGHLMDTAM